MTTARVVKAFKVRTSIRAKPELVWALLTDAQGYVRWNNSVQRVEGVIALGHQVTVYPKTQSGRAFPVRVVEFQPPRRMVWTAGMPFALFKGERTFLLTAGVNGEVEFFVIEEYTGLMASWIVRSIPDLQPAFDEFANDLKHAAETI